MRFWSGAAPVSLLRWLPPVLFSVLWFTLPAFEPSANVCGATPSNRPERLMQVWIRSRPLFAVGGWRDTLRYNLRATDRPGDLIAVPFVHHVWTEVFQVALVDSAGNVSSCWSNQTTRFRASATP